MKAITLNNQLLKDLKLVREVEMIIDSDHFLKSYQNKTIRL